MPARPQPFASDVEFLTAAFEWVGVRSRRLTAERLAAETPDTQPSRRGAVGPSAKSSQAEHQRRHARFRDAETKAKELLDARLKATGDLGRTIGVESLVTEHGLADFERTVLLLAALVAYGEDFGRLLDGSGTGGYYGGPITPEAVWRFMEFGLAERIRSRTSFAPTAPLLKAGLIVLHLGPDWVPSDLPTAHIDLTVAAFARIVGVDSTTAAPVNDGDGPF